MIALQVARDTDTTTVLEAADRAGLKSVAIHYPAASPARAPLAHTVDGGMTSV